MLNVDSFMFEDIFDRIVLDYNDKHLTFNE